MYTQEPTCTAVDFDRDASIRCYWHNRTADELGRVPSGNARIDHYVKEPCPDDVTRSSEYWALSGSLVWL